MNKYLLVVVSYFMLAGCGSAFESSVFCPPLDIGLGPAQVSSVRLTDAASPFLSVALKNGDELFLPKNSCLVHLKKVDKAVKALEAGKKGE